MIANWKFLVELLKDKPHEAGAEIGVFEGECSVKLLENLPGLRMLLCVDPWLRYKGFCDRMPKPNGRIGKAEFDEVYRRFLGNIEPHRDRVIIMRTMSHHAAAHVANGSLDFVFIDGNHTYEYVISDIREWLPKVAEGGVIAGHDYKDKPNYGVIQAVKESFGKDFSVDIESAIWHKHI